MYQSAKLGCVAPDGLGGICGKKQMQGFVYYHKIKNKYVYLHSLMNTFDLIIMAV